MKNNEKNRTSILVIIFLSLCLLTVCLKIDLTPNNHTASVQTDIMSSSADEPKNETEKSEESEKPDYELKPVIPYSKPEIVDISEMPGMKYDLVAQSYFWFDIDFIAWNIQMLISPKQTDMDSALQNLFKYLNERAQTNYSTKIGKTERFFTQEMIIDASLDNQRIVTYRFLDKQSQEIEYSWYNNGKLILRGNSIDYNGTTYKFSDVNINGAKCFTDRTDDWKTYYYSIADNKIYKVTAGDIPINQFSSENLVYCDVREKGKDVVFSVYEVGSENVCFSATVPLYDPSMGLGLSQIQGNAEKGKILFTNNVKAYMLEYPSGELTELGNYMFQPMISPDGKYLAYSALDSFSWDTVYAYNTSNEELAEEQSEEQNKQLEKMENAVYILELSSGKTAKYGLESMQDNNVAHSYDELEANESMIREHEFSSLCWIEHYAG